MVLPMPPIPHSGRRPHSHAALAREDVDDSKRCAPPGDLAAFTQARGLTFGGSALIGALAGVLPTWSDYIFNCCHGDLGGRYGLVEHELMELSADENGDGGSGINMNGSFYAVRRGAAPGWKKRMIPGARFIGLFEPKNEPFAAFASWVPTTTVAFRVPEAALLGRLRVRSADRVHAIGCPKLDQYGLGQFRLIDSGKELGEQTRAAILAGTAGQALGAVRAPYVSLDVHHGQLALTRNGFVMDEAVLDELIGQAHAIAGAIAEVCRPGMPPTAHFDEPVPVLGPQEPNTAPIFPDDWDRMLDAAAAELGLMREDPYGYHAAFPRLPVPGRARGVLRGTLGGGLPGRLAFHQQGGFTQGTVRGAALFAARPDTPDSPRGGVRHEPTDMYVEVREGVVACWCRVRTVAELQAADVAARAQATVRELGLVG